MTTLSRLRLPAAALLLPTALLLGSIPTRAQAPTPADTSPSLTVGGHGEIQVAPDVAHLTVSITTQASIPAEAGQRNAQKTAAVLAALKATGIAAQDIQTSDYEVQPLYDYKASPARLKGYKVSSSITATVHHLASLGSVIDRALRAGATNVSGLSYDLLDRAAAEQRVLKLAVRDAEAKADAMAQAAGMSRGPVRSLSEDTSDAVQAQAVAFDGGGGYPAPAPRPATLISSGQMTVTEDITAVYGLVSAP